MKIDNADFAFTIAAMADSIAATHNVRVDAVRAFAQYMIDHPTTEAQHATAMTLLGLVDVPAETWGQPPPSAQEGATRVADAVQRLNSEYGRSTLHAVVALRRLAWHCTQLARELANESVASQRTFIEANGNKTDKLFLPQPLHDDFTREDYRALIGRKPRSVK